MDTPRISFSEFLDKYPPQKRRESIFSKYRKEILLMRRKGYTIPQIVTFFDVVVGQKVSRFSVRNYLSTLDKKTKKPVPKANPEPTDADSEGVSCSNSQSLQKETSTASPLPPASPLSRTTKKQEMESRAAKYDT